MPGLFQLAGSYSPGICLEASTLGLMLGINSLGNFILCYTMLYYTIVYYTMPYNITLYYTILYYTILYYTILYYTILYYTILYYTVLYYCQTLMLFVMPTLRDCRLSPACNGVFSHQGHQTQLKTMAVSKHNCCCQIRHQW